MKNWMLAALVLGMPMTGLARSGGWGRSSGGQQPASRSVYATHIQATRIQAAVPSPAARQSRGVFSMGGGATPTPGPTPSPTPSPTPVPNPKPTPTPPQPPADTTQALQAGPVIRALGYGTQTANDSRTHWIESGDKISMDMNPVYSISGVGAGMGKPDKLPPPNPGANGRASGRNAITTNYSGD